ncbi:flavin reductase family protein [Chryseobacterium sp. PBS4-4]|uniref:Flavin reductase family protein n=1 Tax=Chryseobacterium edaphi TaxID=2976532 RepID=A0ABT2WAV2_9FLAO|nr:flavin reductase family protein [Chryseobacterium edaphi]MCU7619345.1 flavin reductase family protein [Chryseobacterium edaphi]
MKKYSKKSYPVEDARHFLEPTPTVLVTSAYKGEQNIMTMGWYTIMEFKPSLIGCMISSGNHSFELIRKSKECVIIIPTLELSQTVVAIGNCSGADVDKFNEFDLDIKDGDLVKAPLLENCFANFECRLYNNKLIKDFNFFIFEIVKAHVATSPKYPKTIQYRGESHFVESGRNFIIPSSK